MTSFTGMYSRRPAMSLTMMGIVVLIGVVRVPAHAQEKSSTHNSGATHQFAQNLVNQTLAAHPEADEIGIAVQSSRSCRVVASTDRSDVGEACESDDRAPIETGKPHVGKEGGEFDVSVPLHDKAAAAVGSVTVRFKKAANQTNASVAAAATAIAHEMAQQIPSKAALTR